VEIWFAGQHKHIRTEDVRWTPSAGSPAKFVLPGLQGVQQATE
jgi:hypothetical protein